MTETDIACVICEGDSKRRPRPGDCYEYECPQCGAFEITAEAAMSRKKPGICRKLSGWIRDRNRDGIVPQVTTGTLSRMASYLAVDELTAERGRSEEVFIAMSFSPQMTSAYEAGLQVGIERAGYVPIRVDRTEHVNRIDDEIVARIRRSAFVVADFTEQKSGVYFEAGFALGLNLPVIWSCRQDDIGNLHFDVRQYNCIDWTDEADLANRLRLRIEAIVGQGPRAV